MEPINIIYIIVFVAFSILQILTDIIWKKRLQDEKKSEYTRGQRMIMCYFQQYENNDYTPIIEDPERMNIHEKN